MLLAVVDEKPPVGGTSAVGRSGRGKQQGSQSMGEDRAAPAVVPATGDEQATQEATYKRATRSSRPKGMPASQQPAICL